MSKKVLLIDLGHLSHRYLFAQSKLIKEIGFGVLRHSLLATGIFYSIAQHKPDQVYIGVDYKKSWRKETEEFYKANRAGVREKSASEVDWNEFYAFMEEFTTEIKDVFPFYTPLIPRMEADDVIGWLTKTLPGHYHKTIVTGDGDYLQLLKYPNTKLWVPHKKQFAKCLDPEKALQMKIICGDKSDNIPGVQKGIGKVKAENLVESGELNKLLNEVDGNGNLSEFRRNYDRNKRLIDMDHIPEELTKQLQQHLIDYKIANGSKMFKYFIDKGLREMFDNIDRYRMMLKPLIETKDTE